MAEKNVNIKITADDKQAQGVINKTVKALNKLANNKTADSLGKLGGAVKGVQSSFGMLTKATSAIINAISESNKAFREQEKAENALEKAARNNPYMNSESVDKIKIFTNEIQRTTNVSDNELIPMFTRLAATGRTTEEAISIVTAAVDVAASGTMSLESAVTNLNKTYSGLAGELGESMPAIRELTAEELKQGKAIAVVQEKYKGIAASVVDSTTQRANAFQNLKESFGSFAESTVYVFEKAATSIFNSMADKIADFNDWLKHLPISANMRSLKEAVNIISSTYTDKNGSQRTGAQFQTTENLEWIKKELELKKELNAEEMQALIYAKAELALRESSARYEEDELKKAKEKAALEARAVQAKDEYTAAIEAFEKQIALKKDIGKTTGEQITREDELRSRLDAIVDAYYKMRLAAGSAISDENAFVQKILETIRNIQEELKALGAEFAIPEFSFSADNLSLEDQIKELDAYKASLEKLASSVDPNTEAFTNLSLAIEKVNAEMERLRASQEGWNGMTLTEKAEFINEQMETLGSGIGTALQTAGEAMENQATADLTNLENAYKKGEITEEEYYAKKEKLEKQAAKDQYKVQLAEWGLNLIMTQSSMALAIAKALSSGTPPLNIVTAAVTGAMAAAQLAAQIAAKPVPPAFATGGIVGGNSYTGDKLTARVNSGEMILNAQ